MKTRLIVGLGNPGSKYVFNRHNAGIWFLHLLARRYQSEFKKKSNFTGQIAAFEFEGEKVFLYHSDQYMNQNGQGVGQLMRYHKIPLESILIAHDELDFPVGKIRLKLGGGHGGHNGLRDCIRHCGGDSFARVRIGIDHPGSPDLVSSYVLSNPPLNEAEEIMQRIGDFVQEMDGILRGDYEKAMNDLHGNNVNQSSEVN